MEDDDEAIRHYLPLFILRNNCRSVFPLSSVLGQRDVYTCIDPVNYKPRPFSVRYFRVIATQHSGRSYRGETLN